MFLAILLPIIMLEFHVRHPPFGAAQLEWPQKDAGEISCKVRTEDWSVRSQDLAPERSFLFMCIQIRVIYQLINIYILYIILYTVM